MKSEKLEILSNLDIFDKICDKEGPNMDQIWGQNYLFGDIITNHGNFEMKLGQYVYINGLNLKK